MISTKAPSNTTPDTQVKLPLKASAMNKTEAAIICKKLLRVSHLWVCMVANIAGMPKTSKIFAVFDPTTLPMAMPGTPSMAALTEISSSGAEVPKATIVRLTISAGMPMRRARLTAPFTKASPANSKISRPSPTSNHSIINAILFGRGRGLCPVSSAHRRCSAGRAGLFGRESAAFQTSPARPCLPRTMPRFC